MHAILWMPIWLNKINFLYIYIYIYIFQKKERGRLSDINKLKELDYDEFGNKK